MQQMCLCAVVLKNRSRLHREPEQEREWRRSSPWFTKIKQAAWEAQTVAAVKTSHCFDCFSFCLLSLRLSRRLKCTNGTNKSSTHKLAVLHFFITLFPFQWNLSLFASIMPSLWGSLAAEAWSCPIRAAKYGQTVVPTLYHQQETLKCYCCFIRVLQICLRQDLLYLHKI